MVWELPHSPLNSEEQGSAWSYKRERMSLGTEKGSFGWCALAGKRKVSREKREVSLLHQCTWG